MKYDDKKEVIIIMNDAIMKRADIIVYQLL